MMQTIDQVIDDILVKSPFGAKAYIARQKRQRKDAIKIKQKKDEIIDHPQQIYINFWENNHDN